MDNKILLNSKDTIFEPHFSTENDLPFVFHYDKKLKPIRPNVHENIELLYFNQGCADVKLDADCYSVEVNDVAVVNSYTVHQVIPKPATAYYCFIIDKKFFKHNSIDCSTILFEPFIKDKNLTVIFDKLINEIQSDNKFKNTAIKLYLLEVLLYLCKNHSKPNVISKHEICSSFDYVRKSVDYIKNNLSQKLYADDIAAEAGLSKYYFLREFKKVTGCTFTQYVNTIRCEYAKDLLKGGQHTIKEVAILCGFENYSYFASVFKKATSLLPSEYIKRAQK